MPGRLRFTPSSADRQRRNAEGVRLRWPFDPAVLHALLLMPRFTAHPAPPRGGAPGARVRVGRAAVSPGCRRSGRRA